MAQDQGRLVDDLLGAITRQDVETVRRLLDAGISPDVTNHMGDSALIMALFGRDLPTMAALLDAGANPDFCGTNQAIVSGYKTPLNLACRCGLRVPALLLLERGANPAIANQIGENAAHLLLSVGHTADTPEAEWFAFVEEILPRMLDAGVSPDGTGERPLLHSAMSARVPASVIGALLERGADPSRKGYNGTQFIHSASLINRPDVLRLLALRGIDVDSVDDEGHTALYYCWEAETFAELVGLGANINHQNHKGNTALQVMLEALAKGEPVESRILLLLSFGARVDIRNSEGFTAADLAKRDHPDTVAPVIMAAAAKQSLGRAALARSSQRQPQFP